MAINPMMLMKMKERLSVFQQDHPKVFPFFTMLRDKAAVEGTVYELKVTTPEGESYVANIKLTANDLETIRMLMKSGL